jgi:hypothetical protein
MPTSLTFRLFAAAVASGNIGATVCALDFAECVVESTARTDAEVQQAISDLATKWGITLS